MRRALMKAGRAAGWGIVSLALVLPVADAQERSTGVVGMENVSVAAAERSEVSRLTDAGVVSADGAGAIVVNLVGELRGRAEKEGEIGVLLLPDVTFVDQALRQRRVLLVAHELRARVAAGESSYFMAQPQRFEVGFARYRVLLYNSTGTSAVANVFFKRVR